MAEYATEAGFVQFPVDEREIPSGQVVRDVTIRARGVDGPLLRITVWPEFDGTEINEGDFVAVDGEYTERIVGEGKDTKTYRNINAKKLAVTPAAPKAEREVVNKKSKGSF